MKYARFTVNLEAEQVAALNALARDSQLSASTLARHAIRRFLLEPAIYLPATHDPNKQYSENRQAEAYPYDQALPTRVDEAAPRRLTVRRG